MSTPYQILLQPQAVIEHQIVPGTTFELRFINPAVRDWRLYSFLCHVKDLDDELQFALSSADGEIVVTQTPEEIAAAGDRWQHLTVSMSSTKTALLAELQEFKYDIKATLLTDDGVIYPVWPYARLSTIESVT